MYWVNKQESITNINFALKEQGTVFIPHPNFDTKSFFAESYTRLSGENIILFTSGTTGKPKGVILKAEKIKQSASVFVDWFNIERNSNLFSLAPIHTMSGIRTQTFIPQVSNCNVFTPKNNSNNIFDLIEQFKQLKITHIVAGPPLVKQLSFLLKREPKINLGEVKYILCTGSLLNTSDVQTIWENKAIMVLNYYGLTETYGFCIAKSPDKFNPQCKSVGVAVPDVNISLEDRNTESIGKLVIESPRIFDGYYPNELASNKFNTGDLASINNHGEVTLFGRFDNQITLNDTTKTYPELLAHELSHILQTPVQIKPLTLGYKLSLVSQLSKQHIYNTLKSELSVAKLPGQIEIISELCETPLGKIIRE